MHQSMRQILTQGGQTIHIKLYKRRTKNGGSENNSSLENKSKPHKSQLVTCLQIKDEKNFYAVKQGKFQEMRYIYHNFFYPLSNGPHGRKREGSEGRNRLTKKVLEFHRCAHLIVKCPALPPVHRPCFLRKIIHYSFFLH